MYSEAVTVFNRYASRNGDVWHPTILHGVNVKIDKASMIGIYGENTKDSVILNVRYMTIAGKKIIEGKEYLLPKAWQNQTSGEASTTITFKDGEKFDFFMVGVYPEQSINDNDYEDGFYNYMNSQFDRIFAITSVSEFKVIPHLEIVGK